MVLEGLDDSFGSIDVVSIRQNELPFAVIIVKVFGDGSWSFIVKIIKPWLETFAFEVGEDIVKHINYSGKLAIGDDVNNCSIGSLIVGNKNILFVFQWHGGEVTY